MRVTLEQIILENTARPGDNIEHPIKHAERVYEINGSEFAPALDSPLAAVLDLIASEDCASDRSDILHAAAEELRRGA